MSVPVAEDPAMRLCPQPDAAHADAPLGPAPEPLEPGFPAATSEHAELPSGLRGSPGGPIVRLALPTFAEYLISFGVGLVDTYLAGHINKEATAAVGTGAYFGWFITMVFMVVSTSVVVLVSRAAGRGDTLTARRVLNQGLVLGGVLGAVVSAVVIALAPLVAAQFAQTPAARDYCAAYLRIDAFSYTLASMMFVGAAAVRASGDARTPMLINAVVCATNALLATVLVFNGFGVKGIAFATMTARMLGGLVMLAVLVRGLRGLRIEPRLLRPDRELIGRMLRLGIPGGVDACANILIQALFLAVVARSALGEMGTANYAAHMIAIRFETLSTLIAMAWMTASATLVGQALGRGEPGAAERTGHRAALQAAGLCGLAGAAIFLGADLIYAQMTQDETVRRVGAATIRWLAIIEPVLGAAIVYVGTLRGAGDVRTTMLITLFSGLLVRVPVAYVGAIVLSGGLLGAWMGMFADNIVRLLLSWLRFRQGGWKRVRV